MYNIGLQFKKILKWDEMYMWNVSVSVKCYVHVKCKMKCRDNILMKLCEIRGLQAKRKSQEWHPLYIIHVNNPHARTWLHGCRKKWPITLYKKNIPHILLYPIFTIGESIKIPDTVAFHFMFKEKGFCFILWCLKIYL